MKKAVIILAAGKGIRMKSRLPKALCRLSGRPMIDFLVDAAKSIKPERIVVVGGYKLDLIKKHFKNSNVDIAYQKRLLGSADAVRSAQSKLKGFNGEVVVLYADTPLIEPATVKALLNRHKKTKSHVTILSVKVTDAKEYGRIVRNQKGDITSIVEYTDISDKERKEKKAEINVGAYCFNSKKLFEGLKRIKLNKKKKEFYLTDIVDYFYKNKYNISSFVTKDPDQALGINRRYELIVAENILRERTITKLLDKGVTVIDPANTYIQYGAKIGKNSIIFPFVVIEKDVIVGKASKIGPFAHLRTGTVLSDDVSVGNFVEIVRSKVGKASRAKHHTYLGDTEIAEKVNIGAGTITANYDGKNKNKTVISKGAFIGSGTTIVAPVKIGKNAITGAGSVVVKGKDVPANSVVCGVPAKPIKKSSRRLK